MRLHLFWVIALVCGTSRSEEKKEEVKLENNPAFHEKLLEIAKNYTQYGRVDDSFRKAPVACDAPSGPKQASISHSKDDATHGRKLYFLFARDRKSYFKMGDETVSAKPSIPIDQVLVKESWLAVEVKAGDKLPEIVDRNVDLTLDTEKQAPNKPPGQRPKQLHEYYQSIADADGKKFKAGDKKELFIMYKMTPETPGTDKGWVYGTVTPDGKAVTSSGRVQSCMQCHETAHYERLFGLVPVQIDQIAK